MELNEFLEYLNSGKTVKVGSEVHLKMHDVSKEAMQLTAQINTGYQEPETMRKLFSELIGKPVDQTFTLFPPFYTDCGKNITIGKQVFINMGCKFQDHGVIFIDDGTLIDQNVVLATLNHAQSPEVRGDMIPAAIHIGKKVWIGSNATILPGVTIGDGCVIGAGSVVTRDIPAGSFAAGVPARVIRPITEADSMRHKPDILADNSVIEE